MAFKLWEKLTGIPSWKNAKKSKVLPIAAGVLGSMYGGPALGSALSGVVSGAQAMTATGTGQGASFPGDVGGSDWPPVFTWQPGTGIAGPGFGQQSGGPASAQGADQTIEILGKRIPITAITPAIGAIGSGGISALGQYYNNKMAQEAAQKQMDFQAEQTGSGYQRAVLDMQKSGLNPMLAYSQGPASSGSGAQAQGLGNIGGAGMSSAMAAASTVQGLQNQAAEVERTRAQTQQIESETALNVLRDPLIRAQVSHTTASAQQAQALGQLAEAQLGGALVDTAVKQDTYGTQVRQAEARQRQAVAEAISAELGIPEAQARSKYWKSDWGEVSPYFKDAGGLASGVARFLQLFGGRR